MRKVTREVVGAFMQHRSRKVGNTKTDGKRLYLHGNIIAMWEENKNGVPTGNILVCDCGWPTVTTRDRLNGIPGVRVSQHKHQQYLNGEPWDGEWATIRGRE